MLGWSPTSTLHFLRPLVWSPSLKAFSVVSISLLITFLSSPVLQCWSFEIFLFEELVALQPENPKFNKHQCPYFTKVTCQRREYYASRMCVCVCVCHFLFEKPCQVLVFCVSTLFNVPRLSNNDNRWSWEFSTIKLFIWVRVHYH